LNEFQWAFHEIVVTYGTPNYKEVNPTTFNMVTFPFLFGIMFGDIGHGFLLFLFGAYLCLNTSSLAKNKSLIGFIRARYMFLMMGFFATYCGFIYNDMMAMPLNLFGSCYEETPSPLGGGKTTVTQKVDCVYPFGFDPKWYVSPNELSFFNSFKMKMAVILGVLQMSLGICMKGMNAWYHRSAIDFIFEFIPQLVFLWCLFGFMDILIVLKWLTNWEGREGQAPAVITQMINMALKGGQINGTALIGGDLVQIML
jgi:V-type H+-transporting ATPase subunit a